MKVRGQWALFAAMLLMLSFAPALWAQEEAPPPGPAGAPPVEPSIVREGDFAVSLEQALGVGNSQDEVQAESALGGLGVSPRNGWIADYPVTPDVYGELQNSVAAAANAGKLPMSTDEALSRLGNLSAGLGLGITPYASGANQTAPPAAAYPTPADMSQYYAEQGPPIVTYYNPPPDYYYLYDWVPYPFFVSGFFFPGYFCLHDFHRHFVHHGRPVIVSNHFNDVNAHHMFRIDPVSRFKGNTFAGIGAPKSNRFIRTGVPHSSRAIFNAPRASAAPAAHGTFAGAQPRGAGFPGSGGPTVHGPSFHGGGPPHAGEVQAGGPSHGGGFHGAPGGRSRGGEAHAGGPSHGGEGGGHQGR